MKMTQKNKMLMIIILPIAIVGGFFIGLNSPLITILLLLGLAGFVAWVLMGNKQGAAVDEGASADALSMKPAEGKARIYVMRKGFAAGMQGMNITVGDAYNGQIRSKYFMMAEVDPGTYAVTAQMAKQKDKTRQSTDVTVAAGDIVLIDISLEMGMTEMKPLFEEVRDPSAARQKLDGTKMIAWL